MVNNGGVPIIIYNGVDPYIYNGVPKFAIKIGTLGPYFLGNMGARGPQNWGSPYFLDKSHISLTLGLKLTPGHEQLCW